jgi:hypothetical protein
VVAEVIADAALQAGAWRHPLRYLGTGPTCGRPMSSNWPDHGIPHAEWS